MQNVAARETSNVTEMKGKGARDRGGGEGEKKERGEAARAVSLNGQRTL